jgi:hypothetical protein
MGAEVGCVRLYGVVIIDRGTVERFTIEEFSAPSLLTKGPPVLSTNEIARLLVMLSPLAASLSSETLAQALPPPVRALRIFKNVDPDRLFEAKPSLDFGELLRDNNNAQGIQSPILKQSSVLVLRDQISISLFFLGQKLSHYFLVFRGRDLNALLDEKSPLRLNVRDCRYAFDSACVREGIESRKIAAQRIVNSETLPGLYVHLTDAKEFEQLYSLVAHVPELPEVSPALAFSRSGMEDGPSTASREGSGRGQQPEPADKCEWKTKICISPKDGRISAEFGIKCGRLPEITFSTDGEAAMKLGPLKISLGGHE